MKTCKPGQDRALDLPTIGPDTVRACAAAGMRGIVFHADETLLTEAGDIAALADEHGLFVVGVTPSAGSDA